jgi:hypothetical protein
VCCDVRCCAFLAVSPQHANCTHKYTILPSFLFNVSSVRLYCVHYACACGARASSFKLRVMHCVCVCAAYERHTVSRCQPKCVLLSEVAKFLDALLGAIFPLLYFFCLAWGIEGPGWTGLQLLVRGTVLWIWTSPSGSIPRLLWRSILGISFLLRSILKIRIAYNKIKINLLLLILLVQSLTTYRDTGKYIKSIVYGGLDGIITT